MYSDATPPQEKNTNLESGRLRRLARSVLRKAGINVGAPAELVTPAELAAPAEKAAPFEHPLFHKLEVDPAALAAMDEDTRIAALTDTVREELVRLGIDEQKAVFRGVAHRAGNITPQLVTTYGTDKFIGHDWRNPPQSVEEAVPYRNRDRAEDLPADIYAVPTLDWAIGGFTGLGGLGGRTGLRNFAAGNSDSFILVYDANKVFTEFMPDNKSGEHWRATFLTEPDEALLACIQLTPHGAPNAAGQPPLPSSVKSPVS